MGGRLKTPTEVRAAMVYVLSHARKHLPAVEARPPVDWVDPFSSAEWFGGWVGAGPARCGPGPVVLPGTWMLAEGYLRAGGQIRRDEMPAS